MNLAEFNYLHRAKIENQLVLPHPPTYVIQQKDKGHDVWYFTSQKFITLKKKHQNTTFPNFLKITNIPTQTNYNNQQNQTTPNNLTIPKQAFKQYQTSSNQSLLFIFKQRTNYIESKIVHIINDHEQPGDKIVWSHFKGKCIICEQLQANDYNFALMERKLFLDKFQELQKEKHTQKGITQCQTASLAQKIDKVLKSMLFHNTTAHVRSSQKLMTPQIQSSTFNPYFDNLGSQFKYYITRIQTLEEKHHYMVENKNRANYRSKVQSNSYGKHQQSTKNAQDVAKSTTQQNQHLHTKSNKQIIQLISSVVWNRQYILFDVDKFNRDATDRETQPFMKNYDMSSKVTNSHMKQKITQKCQLIQANLQKHFNKLFSNTFKNKSSLNVTNNDENSVDIIKISTMVKEFRLWFMNNNMKNNHVYTICISDLKVQFSVSKFGVVDKRWTGNFWKRIDLKKDFGFMASVENKNIGVKNNITSVDTCSVRLKAKSNYLHIKRQNYIKGQETTNQPLENKDSIHLTKQPFINDKQQTCTCCLSFINHTDNFQTLSSKRFIISRHVPKLRQIVYNQIQVGIKDIKQQLSILPHGELKYAATRSYAQLQKQNQLIRKLQKKQAKLSNLKSLLNKSNEKQQGISFTTKRDYENLFKRQYEEISVCEECYKIFLEKVIKQKTLPKSSAYQINSVNYKNDSKKVNSFFIKQQTINNRKNKESQSRKRIHSAKNHLAQSNENSKHHPLSFNHLNIRHQGIKKSFTVLNSHNFMTDFRSQQESRTLQIQKRERQSTKDNTTIFQLVPQKISLQRQRINIDDSVQKKKKKTRMEKFEEDLKNQNF